MTLPGNHLGKTAIQSPVIEANTAPASPKSALMMLSNQREHILVLKETNSTLNNISRAARQSGTREKVDNTMDAGKLMETSLCSSRRSLWKLISKRSQIQWQLPIKEAIAAHRCSEAVAMSSVVPIKIAIMLAEISIKSYHRTRKITF